MPELIHHHTAAPIYGAEGDGFDVIETNEISIWHRSAQVGDGYASVDEAISAADDMAQDFDAANLRARTTARNGTIYVRADKVQAHDALDLEGDQYADPKTFADPDYCPTPDETADGFRYEMARVYEIERDGAAIVIETSQGAFAFPPDHEIEISLETSLTDWQGD